ncbi:MAG: bifunctional UDP-N-acetylmuramoyl-tripeptide:D-alanyl-D-alanine ligase/alanine racemase, partial [Prevotellaceae bacterium]|nr:bifunctional UDP-N-acetylmuramoyl-tripeptide:D-alanyl-D-alanine ligase/alanine racemase [Prevotellaceae bacterium]
MYSISQIAKITGATATGGKSQNISDIIIDSRSNFFPEHVLFFAIVGERHNGHSYIADLYNRGVRAFVVSENVKLKKYPQATFLSVKNTLSALQNLAAYHRRQFSYPIIGITGSNGKTIVKEWIWQLLNAQLQIIRNPKSYNSQVGVPLSTWQMNQDYQLGIFEAGISLPEEMELIENIIRPNIFIITNIGEAHQEGFATRDQKLKEKLKLALNSECVVYCADHYEIHTAIRTTQVFSRKNVFCWGVNSEADLHVANMRQKNGMTDVELAFSKIGSTYKISIPFTDAASVENALHSFTTCILLSQFYSKLKINIPQVEAKVGNLSPVAMRLDLREGVNGCSIINDAYSSDVPSLRIALDFLNSFGQHSKHTVILSDIEQSGKEDWRLYGEVASLLNEKKVTRLIGIGKNIRKHADLFECEKEFFESTSNFTQHFSQNNFKNEAVLIKGSRHFELEKVSHLLEQKTHLTTLEVNLTALTDNLNSLRSKLKKNTKILVLIKAFAYGAGMSEVAHLLQHQRVDYLGVAFADEGVTLRQAGITMPILVLNPEPGTFEQMISYGLEPEIYSMAMLTRFANAVQHVGEGTYPIHLKLDTGMHRLGFLEQEIDAVLQFLNTHKNLHVSSIFSHLAAADVDEHNDFTLQQVRIFDAISRKIMGELGYQPIRHLANSAGVEKFPQAQFDMVRLGISFYGISASGSLPLRTVSTLKSTIVQIKNVSVGETI